MGNVVLVFDGQDFTFPALMGTPRPDQMQGSPMDRLAEIAGRVSYDSVGRGRPSEDFHANLKAKRHNAVYRHLNLTFDYLYAAHGPVGVALGTLIGRPGVHITDVGNRSIRFTCNGQAALEWHEREVLYEHSREAAKDVGCCVLESFKGTAPLSMGGLPELHCGGPPAVPVDPQNDHEVYASVFLGDVSRVAADELLRHGFECAPSMESTRYVDMSRRPWVPHPLLCGDDPQLEWCRGVMKTIENHCRAAYNGLVNTLSMVRPEAGLKQVRGAARGIIALSASTRLVFTASLAAWRCIAGQRISPHADEEIREVVRQVMAVLKERWPDRFPAE